MLVGLVGYSRAGKDSIAAVLVKNHTFEQRNLAWPIREILSDLFRDVRPDIIEAVENRGWDFVKAKYPESVSAMITLGQKMRDINPDIWLDGAFGEPFNRLVIPDVRQPNEAERIYKLGGELWRIHRSSSKKLGMDGLLDDYDFEVEIYNNGTLAELENVVNAIMNDRT